MNILILKYYYQSKHKLKLESILYQLIEANHGLIPAVFVILNSYNYCDAHFLLHPRTPMQRQNASVPIPIPTQAHGFNDTLATNPTSPFELLVECAKSLLSVAIYLAATLQIVSIMV